METTAEIQLWDSIVDKFSDFEVSKSFESVVFLERNRGQPNCPVKMAAI